MATSIVHQARENSNSNNETLNKTTNLNNNNTIINKRNELTLDYGKMPLGDVYQQARDFVKAKDGTKAIQMGYHDRNMLNVLTKQVHYGKYSEEKTQVGLLDLVGQDRIQLWKSLGDLSKEEAMKRYIELISKVCPLFNAHLEAHKRHLEELEEKKQKLLEEEEFKKKAMSEQREKKLREEDLKLLEENKKRREEIQRKQIQEALNQQTYPHFKAYAEQQHLNNVQAQEDLIKQLQEQHFEQYMNQVYQQQLYHQQQQAEQLRAMKRAQKKQEQSTEDQLKRLSLNASNNIDSVNNSKNANFSPFSSPSDNNSINSMTTTTTSSSAAIVSPESLSFTLVTENEESSSKTNKKLALQSANNQHHHPNNNQFMTPPTQQQQQQQNLVNSDGAVALTNVNNKNNHQEDNNVADEEEDDDEEEELPPISAASMLTRKDIKEFKESVRRDNDAIIKVGSGETVTVRVPTHEDGRLIFWEFATDYYDIGFGLYFEWTISPSNNVTVHVSDSSEDEEVDDDDQQQATTGGAAAAAIANGKVDVEKGDKTVESGNKPPCDEIIPIFRRDCHEEVYAGSHLYPGRGVYLLKFDNSYSLWRSKTLYYRVYYSK